MVAKQHTSGVKVFDGVTGAYLDDFIEVGSGGLRNSGLMTFTETDPVTLAYTGTATAPAAARLLAQNPFARAPMSWIPADAAEERDDVLPE